MGSQEEQYVEFRYYEMPMGRYDLALLGEEWVRQYGTDPLHFHNYLEIGYCYYGSGYLRFGDEKKEYHKGSITIIPANFPHRTQGEAGEIQRWEYLFIDIAGVLKKFYEDNQPFRERFMRRLLHSPWLIDEKENCSLASVVKAVLEENRAHRPHFKDAVNGYLLVLIQEMLRLGDEGVSEINFYESQLEKIREALEYIETHYADEIRIGDLARECYVSESYFRKIFVQCMNVLPLEYVNLVRIQKACDLLQQSGEAIESLARKVGFTSQSTFMRNFKKYVGDTPKQWLLKNGNGSEYVNYHTKVLKGW